MKETSLQDQNLASIKAETLIESLPWLQRFHAKIVVVKFGGNAMVDSALEKAFAEDMAYLRWVGIKPVVVHGGGPQISARLAELGIQSEFKGGLRVTTEETIEVVRDVLRNQISAHLETLINEAGAETQIMSGEDQNLFRAEKTTAEVDGETIDVGLVGEVTVVNPRIAVAVLVENGKHGSTAAGPIAKALFDYEINGIIAPAPKLADETETEE